MKKYLLIIPVVLLSGAALWPHFASAGNPTNSDTGVSTGDSTHSQEARITEKNQAGLLKSDPPPQLTDSQERKNLIERLKRLNDANKVGYVYLLGPQGQLVAYYTIKGKVTSLNSYLTTSQQVACQSPDSSADKGCVVVDSPDLDGSYGKNPEGIFFFATNGAMVEWAGNYMYSDQPLNLTTKPILIQNGQ